MRRSTSARGVLASTAATTAVTTAVTTAATTAAAMAMAATALLACVSAAPAAHAPEWRDLFNGRDFTGWKLKAGTWKVEREDGVGVMSRVGGGYVWTEERFGDFVLDLEFRVAKGTNSGIFIRTDNPRSCVQTGTEIQVLDSHGKTKVGRHDCGAVYDCVAPRRNVSKPPGQWNRIVIVCLDNKINVVLNGEEIVDVDLDRWTEPNRNPDGSKNKFRTAYRDMKRDGHIGFQEHGKPVWFRNVRIRELGHDNEAPRVARVDPFMGEYAGTYMTQAGERLKAEAQVVAAGNGTYRAILTAPSVRELGFSGGKDGKPGKPKVRVELAGSAPGAREGDKLKLHMITPSGGVMWNGEIAGESLTARSRAVKRIGPFDLRWNVRSSSTEGLKPPPGATVLLPFAEGERPSLDAWTNTAWKTSPEGWMQITKGDNFTKREIGSMRLHLEFMVPFETGKLAKGRGNSGVYIMERYEIQIIESFARVPQAGDCAAVYKQTPPMMNACLPPARWQTYDIVLRAAKMGPDGKTVEKLPVISVLHNGRCVHERQVVKSATGAAKKKGHAAKGRLKLQNHGHPVKFRNIWLVELD